jgi:demethylmenaquinone methyltransferase/2-methoxy-6-polyprenyl-1,4-benzoquinol methylase
MAEDRPNRTAPPPARVAAMFDDVVERYDLLNGVLSLGLDRVWRRAAARPVSNAGGPVLDLGCGTGDLTALLARRHAAVGVDLSGGMLARAQRKLHGRAALARASAFALPFAPGAFGGAASAFVLRNLHDLPAALTELARVVRPGGPVALVDITEPPNPLLRRAFDAYFARVAPALGSLVGKRDAYRYLVRSLGQLPPADRVVAALGDAGFEGARARPLTGGMVTLFTARRSGEEREPNDG